MALLNQIIAIEKGIKARSVSTVTELYKEVQKPALFNGFNKTYQRADEDGDNLPPEKQHVQRNSQDVLKGLGRAMAELMEVTARKDWSNCDAKGDVIVNDEVLIRNVPVTYLLFLEKQLTDIRTFVNAMPTLDEAEAWKADPNTGLYRTEAVTTHRTRKTQKPIVLYPATPEHPAQTQLITEDVLAGHWSTTKHSGAMMKPEKQALVGRVERLLKAVKEAREKANVQEEVKSPDVAKAVFGYLSSVFGMEPEKLA